MKRVFIVSGNRREFLDYCSHENINPTSKNVVYISKGFGHRLLKDRGWPIVKYIGSYSKRKDYLQIKEIIMDVELLSIRYCNRCLLHTTRRNVVLGRGILPADALFIGEGPGKTEDVIGQSFIGKAGKLLDQMCIDAKLTCTKYFTNVVLCHPTDTFDGSNREPRAHEIAMCLKNVDYIITTCKPKVIVLVGSIAQKYYGDLDLCPIVHIQHPSFILRTGGIKSPHYVKNVHVLEELHDYV